MYYTLLALIQPLEINIYTKPPKKHQQRDKEPTLDQNLKWNYRLKNKYGLGK